jgi:DNA-binding GntR family transcriptional regulator
MWQDAYEVLRDAIVRGDLLPGEQVKDGEIAKQLGLSRTPVREAIARLIDAGLLESKAGAYTRVTDIRREDAEASLAVLRALDQLAVQVGAPRLTERHLQRMRKANREFAKAVAQQNAGKALDADDAFHGVFIEVAGNPLLTRLINQLHPQIHRILFRKFSTLMGGRDTIDHHDRLIALCEAGDFDAAVEISGAHWQRLGGLIGMLFDQEGLTPAEATV